MMLAGQTKRLQEQTKQAEQQALEQAKAELKALEAGETLQTKRPYSEYMTKARREAIKQAFVYAASQYAEKAPNDNIIFMQGLIVGWTGKTLKEIMQTMEQDKAYKKKRK